MSCRVSNPHLSAVQFARTFIMTYSYVDWHWISDVAIIQAISAPGTVPEKALATNTIFTHRRAILTPD